MAKGGFFKGEKKKAKKDKDRSISGVNQSSAPVYSVPEVISKKKKNNEW
ncbi:MAG: hypothetical protein AAB478_05100 [Patescibacteria group bacterium]